MDPDSNVIPFPKIELNNLESTENLNTLEYSSVSGFQILSPQELVQNHPEAAKALFNCAREQYQIAVETMGFLEHVFNVESHTAEIIDAREPAIWRDKSKK